MLPSGALRKLGKSNRLSEKYFMKNTHRVTHRIDDSLPYIYMYIHFTGTRERSFSFSVITYEKRVSNINQMNMCPGLTDTQISDSHESSCNLHSSD